MTSRHSNEDQGAVKFEISHMEKALDTASDELPPYGHISDAEHNKIFRKVDWHLMPMLMALYLIANLDRWALQRPHRFKLTGSQSQRRQCQD
jgi:hypothetical protein